jgi:hypothetical protein
MNAPHDPAEVLVALDRALQCMAIASMAIRHLLASETIDLNELQIVADHLRAGFGDGVRVFARTPQSEPQQASEIH